MAGRFVMQRRQQMQESPEAAEPPLNPHKWGESYAAMRDTMRPAPKPVTPAPAPAVPPRAPIAGRGTRAWMAGAQARERMQPIEPMQPKAYPDHEPMDEVGPLGVTKKKRPFFGNNY